MRGNAKTGPRDRGCAPLTQVSRPRLLHGTWPCAPRAFTDHPSMKHPRISRCAIALAALLACSTTLAQVSVYGVADAGLLISRPISGAATTEIGDGIQTSSRFGFRGAEAIGPQAQLAFVLEGGVSIDDGKSAQGGRLFGRRAWVGLLHKNAQLRVGRQYGVGSKFFRADTSPFGTTFRDAGVGAMFSSASGRLILDNMVELRSGDVGGFTGALGYSLNAGGSEVAGAANNFSVLTSGLQYRSEAIFLAISLERFACAAGNTLKFSTCNARTRDDQSHLQVGGSIGLEPFRLYAMWALEQNQFSFFAITPARKSHSYEAGVKLSLMGGELLAAAQARRDEWGANLAGWGLGYTHALSRRSNLYGFVADTRAKARLSAVATGDAGYTPAQIDAYAARDRSQLGVGVRHLF